MGEIAFSYKPNPAAAQYLLNAGLKAISLLLMQEQCFANNVEHAGSHRHVKTNNRSAVTAEFDNDGYSALMLAIDLFISHPLLKIVFILVTGAGLLPAEIYMALQT